MTEELKKTLESASTDALQSLVRWAKDAEGFARDQAPKLAKEIVWSGYVTNIEYALMTIVITSVVFVLLYRVYRYNKDWLEKNCTGSYGGDDYRLGRFLSILGIAVTAVFGLFFALYSVGQIFYIYFCPRIYILERVSDMIK